MPSAERCDGLDNDCDGAVDETFTELGTACTLGRGACQKTGELVCGGEGTVCSITPGLPSTEACNGVDDDCDGTVDNNPFDAPLCPKQLGVCEGSKQRCVNLQYTTCDAAAYGTDFDATDNENRCDGLDNDCDGQVDEGYALKAGDLEITELVTCPQQTWNDVLDTFSGHVARGGNGVPFDEVPGTGDLSGANVADQTWFEIENRTGCTVTLANVKFLAGTSEATLSALVPALARDAHGGACSVLGAGERCVLQGGAALRGSDSSGFTRIVRITRADGVPLDTLSATQSGKCADACRLANVRHQALSGCCEGESHSVVRNSAGVRSLTLQAATPLWPNDVRTTYRSPSGLPAALNTEVVISEVFALDAALDVNDDGAATIDEDGFIEVAPIANRKLDLGRMRLSDIALGGDPLLHQFSCFAPIDDAHRMVIFGGARAALLRAEFGEAHLATSSRGEVSFALARGTAMTLELETSTGGKAARAELGATALTGASVQSRSRCAVSDGALSLACDCRCRGQDASCAATCHAACEVPTLMSGCFGPGE